MKSLKILKNQLLNYCVYYWTLIMKGSIFATNKLTTDQWKDSYLYIS